jgi:hypothetical protein
VALLLQVAMVAPLVVATQGTLVSGQLVGQVTALLVAHRSRAVPPPAFPRLLQDRCRRRSGLQTAIQCRAQTSG